MQESERGWDFNVILTELDKSSDLVKRDDHNKIVNQWLEKSDLSDVFHTFNPSDHKYTCRSTNVFS